MNRWLVATVASCLAIVVLANPAPSACTPTLAWQRSFENPGSYSGVIGEQPFAVTTVDGDNIVVVSSEDRFDLGHGSDWRILKYDGAGSLAWIRTYVNPSLNGAFAYGATTSRSGNVVVVGNEYRSDLGQDNDWRINAYSDAGSLLWTATYDDPSHGSDVAKAVATDSLNDVVVVGTEFQSGLSEGIDWRVIEFDSSGAILWSQAYDGPDHANDAANAVAVDGADNVIVAGTEDMTGSGQGVDWRVNKYDRYGHLTWSRSYNDPNNADDGAYGVAVDRAGNAVVVGYEDRTALGHSIDWRVIKYDPDGNVLWTRSYNGRTNGGDVASAVAIDGSGNAFVTGWVSRTDTGSLVAHTIEYDPAGDAIWSEDYQSVSSASVAVAVNASGGPALVAKDYYIGDFGPEYRLTVRQFSCGGPVPPTPTTPLAGAGQVVAFPNPVGGDRVTLALGLGIDADQVEVQVFTIGMHRVFSATFANVRSTPGQVTLTGVSGWAPGVYLVQVRAKVAGGWQQTLPLRKLVVKR